MVAHAITICVSLVSVVDVGAVVSLIENICEQKKKSSNTLSLKKIRHFPIIRYRQNFMKKKNGKNVKIIRFREEYTIKFLLKFKFPGRPCLKKK